MKTTKLLSVLLTLFMCTFIALSFTACSQDTKTDNTQKASQTQDVDPLWKDAVYQENTTIGQGQKVITAKVTAGEKSINITLNTDADTLEQALVDSKLVEGEESQYGLFIKKVNGIVADYDEDASYWAIYKDSQYLTQGANNTQIATGDSFELVRTK